MGQKPIEGSNPSLSAISKAPVAQLDRASGYEPGGQEFESLRARQSNVKTTNVARTTISPKKTKFPEEFERVSSTKCAAKSA